MKPNNLTVYAQRADGTRVDITEEVRARLGIQTITENYRFDAVEFG
jgi:hypothetical protein